MQGCNFEGSFCHFFPSILAPFWASFVSSSFWAPFWPRLGAQMRFWDPPRTVSNCKNVENQKVNSAQDFPQNVCLMFRLAIQGSSKRGSMHLIKFPEDLQGGRWSAKYTSRDPPRALLNILKGPSSKKNTFFFSKGLERSRENNKPTKIVFFGPLGAA